MYERELDAAIRAVRAASELCMRVQHTFVTEESISKKDKSPVTIADLGAQAIISHLLSPEFPEDPLVAEEDTDVMRDPANAGMKGKVLAQVALSLPNLPERGVFEAIDRGKYSGGRHGRFWTVDPIDGTKGFIRGDQYALALALIENGEPVLGVLGCPNLPFGRMANTAVRGSLLFAAKGLGAQEVALAGGSPAAVRVSESSDPAQAVFCESFESAHTAHSVAGRVAESLRVAAEPIRVDSQCKYALVARGEAMLYMRIPGEGSTYREKIWDHAAGWIIVKESGGRVTDVAGTPLDFSLGRRLEENRGVIASNGHLHAAVLAAIAQAV